MMQTVGTVCSSSKTVGTVCSIAAKLQLSGQTKFDGQPQNFSSVAKFVADNEVLGI